MYEYKVREIKKVLDGDTVDCVIDLGFGILSNFRFRLANVDTPEKGHPDWLTAKEMTTFWFSQGADGLTVTTQKAGPSTNGIGDGAFGRWLGVFARSGESLNDLLIQRGWGSDY